MALSTLLGTSAREGDLLAVEPGREPGRGLRLEPENLSGLGVGELGCDEEAVGRRGDGNGRMVTVESSPFSDIAPAPEDEDTADDVRVR